MSPCVFGGKLKMRSKSIPEEELMVETETAPIRAILALPRGCHSIVLFAHGAGSSRHSPRNRYVAGRLNEAGFGTMLMDLLTVDEERIDLNTGRLRFDIPLLAGRLDSTTEWVLSNPRTAGLDVGYFGASTGAAAALVAAVQRPQTVKAIVSRGGRPDLAARILPQVEAAVLLLVGAKDRIVLDINKKAGRTLNTTYELVVVPGASHLFEEPGTLEAVAKHAIAWFGSYMTAVAAHAHHWRRASG